MTAELVTLPPTHATTDLAYRTLASRINGYLSGPWWTAKGYPGTGLPTLAKDEYGIRGAGMAALGLAAGWVTRTVMSDVAATRAVQLSSAAAEQHQANAGPSGWGMGDTHPWQEGYWAALNGLASLLLWPTHLTTSAQREPVARMIEAEANRLLAAAPTVWTDTGGTVLRPGNSQIEENQCNATLMALAAAAMPGHANAAVWRHKAVSFAMVGAAHPDDRLSSEVVNGAPVATWCAAGWNVQPDYTVINHDRIHPDYSQTVTLGLQAALTFALFGQPAPVGLAHNAANIYAAMQTAVHGGRTMYEIGNPLLWYPEGGDWGNRRPAGYACWDTMMDALGLDPHPASPAVYWEALHIGDASAMQLRPASTTRPAGVLVTTTNPNPEDIYRSRVEWSAGHFGLALLARWAGPHLVWTNGAV